MQKITRLTDEQAGLLPAYRAKWLHIGLSTEPADTKTAEEAIDMMYDGAGFDRPQKIWLSSPFSCLISSFSMIHPTLWPQIRARVRDTIRAQVWTQVGAQVWEEVGDQVREEVREEVGARVREEVWTQVGARVREEVGDQVREEIRAQVGARVREFIYGQSDADWLGPYDFLVTECGIELPQLRGLWALAQSAHWCLPYRTLIFCSDRPRFLQRDERNRLHCEDHMALEYRDGWGIYAWHGVRVSEKIIMAPDTLTVQEIRAERNAEVQRIMIERFGWDRLMHEEGAEHIDVDTEPAGAPGLRALMRLKDGSQVLVCCCASTGKTFHLEVPPEVRTCHQAASWLAQEDDLQLIMRT